MMSPFPLKIAFSIHVVLSDLTQPALEFLLHHWQQWMVGFDATICTDGPATQIAVMASLSPLTPPLMTIQLTVNVIFRPANGARPCKLKRKVCELPTNWYRGCLPPRGAQCFRQYVNTSTHIYTHPSKLARLMKIRFSTLLPRSMRGDAISLSHGALSILESTATC